MQVRASAPGKTILIGEHAAVFGAPAVVTAVSRRLVTEIGASASSRVELVLADLGIERSFEWNEVAAYTELAHDRWRRYCAQRDLAALERMVGDDPAHLAIIALGEAASAAGRPADDGLRLAVRSQIPIGSGFGSSAATAVAVVAAYFTWCGRAHDSGQLRRTALEIEKRQHGSPSGIDSGCVVEGGVVWCERDTEGTMAVRPLATAASQMKRFRVIDTGRPSESTGAVVAAVRAKAVAQPRLIESMERSTRALASALTEQGSCDEVIERIGRYERCLEELGVVPAHVRELVREIEKRGGAAKISGAGTLGTDGAGALLVYHREPELVRRWSLPRGCELLDDIALAAPGVESHTRP